MELRSLRPDELDAWFDFLAMCFNHPKDHHVRHWEGDPQRSVAGIRVIADGDRLFSTLRIFPRTIYLGGCAVPMGGIGEVCTHPEYRGHGFSGRLLEDAIGQMASAGMAVSTLFTGIHGHYARYGWRPLPVEVATADITPTAATELQIAPANPRDPAEARQLQVLYETMARQYQGTMLRSDLRYWTGWVAGEWQRAVVARRNQRIIGYLAARWTGSGELYIQDFASDPAEATPVFQALVGRVAQERGPGGVRVKYPWALRLDLSPVVTEQDRGAMYRAIRPQELPLAAAQALEQMLRGEVGQHLIWPTDLF